MEHIGPNGETLDHAGRGEKMAQDEWLPDFENAMVDVLTSSSKPKPKTAKKLKLVMPPKPVVVMEQNGELLDLAAEKQPIDDVKKRKEVTDAFAAVAAEKRKKAEKLEMKAKKFEKIVQKRKQEDQRNPKKAKTENVETSDLKCEEILVPLQTKCVNIRITW